MTPFERGVVTGLGLVISVSAGPAQQDTGDPVREREPVTDTERLDFIELWGSLHASKSWSWVNDGLWREDLVLTTDDNRGEPGFSTFREMIDYWIIESQRGDNLP